MLIIVCKHCNNIEDKDKLINIYKNFFKEIIIYSDYPFLKDNHFNYKVIEHFYENYNNTLDQYDGLFYIMDNTVINLNILQFYNSDKIIAPYTEGFSNYFYIPKKYLNSKLFNMFDKFHKDGVQLENVILSILNSIEKDKNNYNNFEELLLCDREQKILEDYSFVRKSINTDFNLIIHPIKFASNPNAFDSLSYIFDKKKCVIITTINSTTDTIRKHMDNKEYDVIIVGDKKTPNCYKNENCIYLDLEAQEKFFPKLSQMIPYNHYGRKNFGYLFAIQKGYDIIYETDDDNIPFDNFDNIIQFDDTIKTIQENDSEWINIFKYFTNNSWIWPRGYPLSHIKKHQIPNYTFENTRKNVSIINGLVENDPDVDALFRLICNHEVDWDKNKKIIVSNKNICVFNTQNTFWIDHDIFIALLLPCSVSFRYSDILKGLIANILLKCNDKNMAYTSPNVIQIRNEHDLISDLKSEFSMYISNENIIPIIQNGVQNIRNNKEILYRIYENLFDNNIITQLDLDICKEWLTYF